MPKPKLFLAALLVAGSLAFPASAQATLAYVGNVLSNPTVFVARDDGSQPRRIARGFSPHVSPDGHLIAYLNEGRRFEQRLELKRVGGGRPRTLLVGWRESDELAFSPNSRKILALQGPPVGMVRLMLIDVASGKRRFIARGFFAGFGFSPEGSEFVYARASAAERPFRSDVFRASVEGGEPVRLTDDHRSSNPLWGPRNIAFVKAVEAKARRLGPKNELFLMDRRGTAVNRLTHTDVPPRDQGLLPVDWSADGRRLLAEFEGRSGGYAVAVDPLTGAQRPVEDGRSSFIGTALSADGANVLGYTEAFEGPQYVGLVPYDGGDFDTLADDAVTPDWSR